jgi:CubicO group peptidase (beta-lactamase class C family)
MTSLAHDVDSLVSGYCDRGQIPGAVTLVARDGQIEHLSAIGYSDIEGRRSAGVDTIFRIYSMTKPVTAAAALALVDEGLLDLDAPVHEFIPSFAELTVDRSGGGAKILDVPCVTPMKVRHLLTHTSGLTYGEGNPGAVSARYVEQMTDFGPEDGPLADVVDRLAGIPLLFQPGTRWAYGVSLDVLGRVLEVASGVTFDELLHSRIIGPCGMSDTGFSVPVGDMSRVAALYQVSSEGGLDLVEGPADLPPAGRVTTFSGGAGLLSTAFDYLRFAQMLLNGGQVVGERVLSAASTRQMLSNQIPGDLAAFGESTFNETATSGVGFGFGGSVVVDPLRTAWSTSRGEYAWGGFASTAFWIDPEHQGICIFMTQVMPSDRYPIRGELRDVVTPHWRRTIPTHW